MVEVRGDCVVPIWFCEGCSPEGVAGGCCRAHCAAPGPSRGQRSRFVGAHEHTSSCHTSEHDPSRPNMLEPPPNSLFRHMRRANRSAPPGSAASWRQPGLLTDRLVQEQRLADVLNLRDGAAQIEGFGEDDFEYLGAGGWLAMPEACVKEVRGGRHLLHVDAVAGAAEDEACLHCFGEASGLSIVCR